MKKLFLTLLACLMPLAAMAQSAPPTPAPVSVYVASVPLAVTTSSARVALPSTVTSAIAVTLSNDGANDLCFALGDTSVVATNGCLTGASSSTSLLLPAGRSITVYKNSTQVDVAAIGAGSTTLRAYQGNGPVLITGSTGGTAGGGGPATIADGADVAQGSTTNSACAGDTTSGCTIEARIQRLIQRLTTINTTLATPAQDATVGTTNTNVGPPGATACATDTGSCSANALLQRLSQRITSLITALGSPFQAGGIIGNTTFASTVADGGNTTAGTTTDSACSTDNGTCTLEALIKRLNQRLTTLNTTLGSPYQASGALPLPAGAATSANQSPCLGGTCITCSSGDVANTNAVCTLAGVANKTTYITGFRCTANGATVTSTVALTVAGVVTATMSYDFTFPASVSQAATSVGQDFTVPVPASAVNTAIVVTLPASGSGGVHASCSAQGLQL